MNNHPMLNGAPGVYELETARYFLSTAGISSFIEQKRVQISLHI